MNREPFDGDPAISEDEFELEFDFDPKHDYMADVNAMYPGWRIPGAADGVTYMPPGGAPSSAAFSDVGGPREVHSVTKTATGAVDAKGRPKLRTERRVLALPHKPYVRWIDLAGNLGALLVSSVRPDKENPTGDDGTMTSRIDKKQRRGGIVLEGPEGDAFRNPWAPYAGQQYTAWALAVAQHRKALHATYTKQEQTQWEEEKRKELRAMNAENAAATGVAIGAAMKDALKEVVSEVRGADRKPKVEKPAQP